MPPTVRAGESWDDAEYEQLVHELATGVDFTEIAVEHGRTVKAIRAQARRLIPPESGAPTASKARYAWLRDGLAAGTVDWRAALRHNVGPGIRNWTAEDDRLLAEAWDAGHPGVADLAARFDFNELGVVKRLIALGAARSLVEVTDRLSYDPHGDVAMRRTLALDAEASAVHVLVIVGEGSLQISVHRSERTAEEARDRHLGRLSGGEYQWTIGQRFVGGFEGGTTDRGTVVVPGDSEESLVLETESRLTASPVDLDDPATTPPSLQVLTAKAGSGAQSERPAAGLSRRRLASLMLSRLLRRRAE